MHLYANAWPKNAACIQIKLLVKTHCEEFRKNLDFNDSTNVVHLSLQSSLLCSLKHNKPC